MLSERHLRVMFSTTQHLKERSVKFAPGEVLVRRHWRGGRVVLMHVVRVAADDERGLRLWLPAGSPYWRLGGPDGPSDLTQPAERISGHVELPAQRSGKLVRQMWTGADVM